MVSTSRSPHYLFSPEHQVLRATIAEWSRARLAPSIDEWERQGEFPRAIFEELGDLGYLGAQYPEEYGGQGGDFASNLILCEEISRVGAESVSTSIAVHTAMATPPIMKFGSEEQRATYLPDLLAGRKIAALGISEPEAGSDVASLRSRARRGGDGWVL